MKKTNLKPEVQVFEIQSQTMFASSDSYNASFGTDGNLEYGGDTTEDNIISLD